MISATNSKKKIFFFFGEPDYYGTQMMTTMTMMMLTMCCRRFNSFDWLSVLSSLIIIIARCASKIWIFLFQKYLWNESRHQNCSMSTENAKFVFLMNKCARCVLRVNPLMSVQVDSRFKYPVFDQAAAHRSAFSFIIRAVVG